MVIVLVVAFVWPRERELDCFSPLQRDAGTGLREGELVYLQSSQTLQSIRASQAY